MNFYFLASIIMLYSLINYNKYFQINFYMHSNDATNSQCENRFSLDFVSKRLHFHPAANTQSMRKNAMRHDRVGDDWLIGVGNCRLKRLGGVD